MASPITSVPDPSQNSALASIITQVQPGQAPVVVRGARPIKKANADPAARRKKKAATAVAPKKAEQDDAVAEAARLGSQAAHEQAAGVASSSQEPLPAPVVASEPVQSTTASAPSSATASATKAPPATTSQPKSSTRQTSSPSFGKRLIALLTCSSASSAMVREEMQEKQRPIASKQAPPATTTSATSTAPVVPTRTSKSPSTEYPTTPGGGTQLPKEETGDVTSGAVVPPGSTFVTPQDGLKPRQSNTSLSEQADSEEDEDEDELDHEEEYLTDDQTEEHRLIMQGGIGIPLDEYGNQHPLLPPIGEVDTGRKCLVLDLDETLVHSSFKMIQNADFIVPVEIDGTVHNVYVIKRPGVDEFMRLMGEIYEVVVFTASLSKYADPVLDMLDIHHAVRHRLFRESCYNHKGNYVKDLSQLGRVIADSIIIDNSPASYIFHPNNAVPISSWFNDPHDTELTDLCPFLADLAHVDDVRAVLDGAL